MWIRAGALPAGAPLPSESSSGSTGRDRVVEVANDIVIPGDRVELDYWIDVS